MNTAPKEAHARICLMLRAAGHDRPADLLADIMHYCDVEGVHFDGEMVSARGYHEEETDA